MTGTTNQVTGDVAGAVVQAGVIHGGLTVLLGGAAASESPPGDRSAPAQLAAPTRIVDRRRERAILDELVGSRAGGSVPPIAVITGGPGMGKTALAVAFATAIRDEFPDGQLQACLRDVCPREVPAMFLRALGVSAERLPAGLDEQVAFYRTLTVRSRLLVLLDDAPDAATVGWLRPACSDSLVLVTNRTPTPLKTVIAGGAQVVPLAPLTPDDAAEVLTALGDRASRDPAGVARLAAWSGGLPMALGLLLAYATVHYDRSPSELADLLPHDPGDGGAAAAHLERALSMSQHDLPDDLTRTMACLALHEGPHHTVTTAAAAAEIDSTEAVWRLTTLAERHLLTRTGELFTVPTAVRDHYRALAATLDPPISRTMVLLRIAAALAPDAARNDHAINGLRPRYSPHAQARGSTTTIPRAEAYAWMDQESPNIVATLLALADLGQYEQMWWLAEALWSYIHRRRGIAAATTVLRLGAGAAHATGYPKAEARLLCARTHALLVAGRTAEAVACAEDAIAVARCLDDYALLASTVSARGNAALALGDLDLAALSYAEAVEEDLLAGNQRGAGLHERRLAGVRIQQGRYAGAVTLLLSAEARLLKHGGPDDLARVRTWLGEALTRDGDFDRADRVLLQAEAGVTASGTARYVADVQLARALWRACTGDAGRARDLAIQAQTSFEEVGGDPRELARAQVVLDEIAAITSASGPHDESAAEPDETSPP